MVRRTKEDAQETRNRILDAAVEVFNRNGVAETSLNDIAREAGVTRGAIYWHFKNKADLFDAMCSRVRSPIRAMVDEIADEKTADPIGMLRVSGRFIRQSGVENPQYRKVMTIIFHRSEVTDADDPIRLYQRDWLMNSRENTHRILANAQSKGQLPAELDLQLGAIMLQATFNGLINNWLLMPASFDLVEDANLILDATIESLRNAPNVRVKKCV